MELQHLPWQDMQSVDITVEEGNTSLTVKVAPVISSCASGINVGLYCQTKAVLGYWYSRTDSLINAWRIAQIIGRMKRVRNRGNGYDPTVLGLVIELTGDRSWKHMQTLARELDMTAEYLDARLSTQWPYASVVCGMWDKLSAEQQEWHAPILRVAIIEGHINIITNEYHSL